MADKAISQLTAAGALSGAEAVPVVQGGDTVKTTTADIAQLVETGADLATQAELDAHVNDPTGAHAASAISVTPAGTLASTTVQAALVELDTDARMSDARAPSGPAGGVLSGTYPDPTFASPMATTAALTAHEADTTAVHGIADTAALVLTGDARLSDPRAPTVHAATHTAGGTDPITVAQSQVTGLTAALGSYLPLAGGTLTGPLTVPTGAPPAGGITFGTDVNLYRPSADVLKTDDHIWAGRNITVGAAGPAAGIRFLINGTGYQAAPNVYGFWDWGTHTLSANGVEVISFRALHTVDTTASNFSLTNDYGVDIGATSKTGTGVISNAYGIHVAGPTVGATLNVSAAIDAAATQTLWVSANANNTTAAAGIAFGSSRDTTLYRSAASTLKSDGALTLVGNLTAPNAIITTSFLLGVNPATDGILRVPNAQKISWRNAANTATAGSHYVEVTNDFHQDLVGATASHLFRSNNGFSMCLTTNPTLTTAAGALKSGAAVTGSRPAAATVGAGARFYDTTLSKPIWSDGTIWRDAAGVAA